VETRRSKRIQSQTTTAKASTKSFDTIDREIAGKFGDMTIPGIEEFYASQAPKDRLTVVQDTVAVTRIMQFVMNAWMDKFYEAAEIEMAELDAMKKWKGKLRALRIQSLLRILLRLVRYEALFQHIDLIRTFRFTQDELSTKTELHWTRL
jgi:hypothetical protein